ncbi:hypothetical protein PYCCODRAFT_713404 [Trametes coccinea BRFM310]|uniref:Uncharacterized protein n=1 Tax=Trametes coccinea (strain BRFM310) TaxID=1353009 RepID=A0A1Y2IGI6_TRAC3|nr:hypothetical protein PYCCODRAFT_713404 [Trametes coccinea BRFM310]
MHTAPEKAEFEAHRWPMPQSGQAPDGCTHPGNAANALGGRSAGMSTRSESSSQKTATGRKYSELGLGGPPVESAAAQTARAPRHGVRAYSTRRQCAVHSSLTDMKRDELEGVSSASIKRPRAPTSRRGFCVHAVRAVHESG